MDGKPERRIVEGEMFGAPLPGWALAAILFAVAGWHVLYRQRAEPAAEVAAEPSTVDVT